MSVDDGGPCVLFWFEGMPRVIYGNAQVSAEQIWEEWFKRHNAKKRVFDIPEWLETKKTEAKNK